MTGFVGGRARNWEDTFRTWARPPSDSEEERGENASRMIRRALDGSVALSGRTIEVFAHGSYRNNTNVKLDSDIDVCVRCMDVCFPDFTFTPDLTLEAIGLVPATYTPAELKADVEAALRGHFGAGGVTRGNKVIAIRENTYRLQADVAPTFERRRHHRAPGGRLWYESGTMLFPDHGESIENWPHQHYDNGVAKNDRTGRRFKAVVRILKRLRNEMAEARVYPPPGRSDTASFLIESVVFNAPDSCFGHLVSYTDDVHATLSFLIEATARAETCTEWGEVNELKYLFRAGQTWTREQAHSFLLAGARYLGMD